MRCIPSEQLTSYLLDELTQEENDEIESHVESCDECQRLLDSLGGDAHQLHEWQRMLRGDEHVHVASPMLAGTAEAFVDRKATTHSALESVVPQLQGYDIFNEIGRGAMGVVYSARHRQLNRPVALKMIVGGVFAGPEPIARFLDEAKLVAKLKHSGIVQIYDIGFQNGLPYLSLELVPGPNLKEFLDGNPVPPRHCALFAQKLTDALSTAHQEAIIHRDLKPENILLNRVGSAELRLAGTECGSLENHDLGSNLIDYEPKITDFGLAKHSGSGNVTTTGQLVGTPRYMAPEQADERFGQVDARTDIYGLGCILYEMLTGRPPMQSSTVAEMVHRLLTSEPLPLRQLDPSIPFDLETIVLKCLEKKPERRYPTADDLRDDLSCWLEHRPIRARRIGNFGRIVRWCRRQPMVSTLTFVLIAVVFAAIVGSVIQWRREFRFRQEAEATAQRETQAKEIARDALLAVEDLVYFDKIRSAHQLWLDNKTTEMLNRLDSCPPRLRNWEWHYLAGLVTTHIHDWQAHSGHVNAVRFPFGSNSLVTAGSDGTMKIWDLETAVEGGIKVPSATRKTDLRATIAAHEQPILDVVYGRHGRLFATASQDTTIAIWDADSGQQKQVLVGHEGPVNSILFANQDRSLVSAGGDAKVLVWDVSSGKRVGEFRNHRSPVQCIALSHDQSMLASHSAWRTVISDFETGETLHEFGGNIGQPNNCVAFAPRDKQIMISGRTIVRVHSTSDAERLASFVAGVGEITGVIFRAFDRAIITSTDRSVTERQLPGGRIVTSFRGHQSAVTAATLSPNGKLLATATETGRIRIWPVGRSLEFDEIKMTKAGPRRITMSPNGEWAAVACEDGSVVILDFHSEKPIRTIQAHERDVYDLAFDASGKWLATGGHDNAVRLWDVTSGDLRKEFWGHAQRVTSIDISPDGKLIASGSSDATVRVWDIETSECCHVLVEPPSINTIWRVAFMDEGKQLVSSGNLLRIWDVESGELAQTLVSQEGHIFGFSADGLGHLAACSFPNLVVSIWHVKDTDELHTIRADARISGISYSPNASRLATAHVDGSVRIWDPQTARAIIKLNSKLPLRDVAFSKDGSVILACNRHAVLFWRTDFVNN